MVDRASTTRSVVATVVGLLLMLAVMPFAPVRLHGLLAEVRDQVGGVSGRSGLTRDDVLPGVFVAAVALVVVLALVLGRPMVMGWAAVPAAVALVVMALVVSDVQFDTSFLASDVQTRVNRDRSVAPAGWVGLGGMVLVVVGLAVPLFERLRTGAIADGPPVRG